MAFRLLPEEVESLWTLFTAPIVWAGHFLLCYVGTAVFCAKPQLFDLGFGTLRLAIVLVTLAALAAIVTSRLVDGSWHILVGGVVGSLVGAFLETRKHAHQS